MLALALTLLGVLVIGLLFNLMLGEGTKLPIKRPSSKRKKRKSK